MICAARRLTNRRRADFNLVGLAMRAEAEADKCRESRLGQFYQGH